MPLRDLLLALLVCLVWAGNFLTSALALRDMPPLLFTGLRLALRTDVTQGLRHLVT